MEFARMENEGDIAENASVFCLGDCSSSFVAKFNWKSIQISFCLSTTDCCRPTTKKNRIGFFLDLLIILWKREEKYEKGNILSVTNVFFSAAAFVFVMFPSQQLVKSFHLLPTANANR